MTAPNGKMNRLEATTTPHITFCAVQRNVAAMITTKKKKIILDWDKIHIHQEKQEGTNTTNFGYHLTPAADEHDRDATYGLQ